jgi:hypothetical protein
MKLSSRHKLLQEADEVLSMIREEIKEDPIWGYETLEDLRQAVRENPKYKKYTDQEIDKMTVPWFIRDKFYRKIERSTSAGNITGFSKFPYDFFHLSNEDKEEIKNGLEQIRKIAIERQKVKDSGQEPEDGYDKDLAIKRKLIIMGKGLPKKLTEKILFAWKYFWTNNGEFLDLRTGLKYDDRGKIIPKSEVEFLNKVKELEVEIQKEKQKKVNGFVEFIKSFSSLAGVQ